MCGIFGFTNFEESNASAIEILKRGADSIHHRGPDDCGIEFFEKERIGFAHRRLSILDLSSNGHQPMSSVSGRFEIVYNGEVYNFHEIRTKVGDNYPFKGGSDTEVLLAAFEKWGVMESVKLFRGMFAFAVLDRKENKILLARDRMGIKPLYFSDNKHGLSFASEIRALVKSGIIGLELNNDSLASYLSNNFVAGENSLLSGVERLRPGCIYEKQLENPEVKGAEISYWDPNTFYSSPQNTQKSFEYHKEAVHEKLLEAVKLRMISDVPLGAFLSGGTDSSLIVALMQHLSSTPVKTFTIGMDEKEFDESSYAASVAEQLGCEHYNFQIEHDEIIKKITTAGDCFDEPMADPSIIPSLLVSEKTRNHVTVALTGDGGDEVFGGYNRHFHAPKIYKRTRAFPNWLRNLSAGGLDLVSNVASSPLLNSVFPYRAKAEKIAKIARIIRADDQSDLYQSLVLRNTKLNAAFPFDAEDYLKDVSGCKLSEVGRQMMAYDLQFFMRYDILPKLDVASMNPSLEARVPLLDHELFELSCELPDSVLFGENSGKAVLKSILNDYIDVSFLHRPKAGFTIPLALWLRNELKDWAYSILFDKNNDSIVDLKLVHQIWDDEMKGRQKEDSELWPLLMLFSWVKSLK